MNEPSLEKKSRQENGEFIEMEEEEHELRIRECSNTCSHYDHMNQCCWLASEKGLCRNVSEGDICLYNFQEGGWE